MKKLLFLFLIFSACTQNSDRLDLDAELQDTVLKKDHTSVTKQGTDTILRGSLPQSNDRFENVTLSPLPPDSATVSGRARIFEATLNYAVYNDGRMVYEGFSTASAGAPEWGDFSFNIPVPTIGRDTGDFLLLFESSAKDGSRVGVLKFAF